MHVEYPMLFKAESTSSGRFTHCGVLEFVAEEGVVYMPHWVSKSGSHPPRVHAPSQARMLALSAGLANRKGACHVTGRSTCSRR